MKLSRIIISLVIVAMLLPFLLISNVTSSPFSGDIGLYAGGATPVDRVLLIPGLDNQEVRAIHAACTLTHPMVFHFGPAC